MCPLVAIVVSLFSRLKIDYDLWIAVKDNTSMSITEIAPRNWERFPIDLHVKCENRNPKSIVRLGELSGSLVTVVPSLETYGTNLGVFVGLYYNSIGPSK